MADTTERRSRNRRLIINADDFGLTAGVSAGIMRAFEAGTVTSVSVLVDAPGWRDAVQLARAEPRLDVGLHFNLLIGLPLTTARSLRAADGGFASLGSLAWRASTGTVRRADVVEECEAQLQALTGAGLRVTHIDSHRHTHALPVIHGAVAQVAAAHGLVLRRPLEASFALGATLPDLARQAALAAAWAVSRFGAPPTRAPDRFAGLSLQGKRAFATQLTYLVGLLPPGTTELMVHPGCSDETLAAIDGYTAQRDIELAALLAPDLRERLADGGVELVGFDAV